MPRGDASTMELANVGADDREPVALIVQHAPDEAFLHGRRAYPKEITAGHITVDFIIYCGSAVSAIDFVNTIMVSRIHTILLESAQVVGPVVGESVTVRVIQAQLHARGGR